MKVEDCKDLRFFKHFAAFGIDNGICIGIDVGNGICWCRYR